MEFEAGCAFLVQFLLSMAQPHLHLNKTPFVQLQPHLGKAPIPGKEWTPLQPVTSAPDPCPCGSTDEMCWDVQALDQACIFLENVLFSISRFLSSGGW